VANAVVQKQNRVQWCEFGNELEVPRNQWTILSRFMGVNNKRGLDRIIPFTHNSFTITRQSQSRSQNYVTTDGQSASLSWNKTPIWGLRLDMYCCQTVAFMLMWGSLSDEGGLSFTAAAGPR
jgi:hypothetical protein